MEQDPGRAESLWIGRERLGEEGGAGRPASFHHRRGRGGGRGEGEGRARPAGRSHSASLGALGAPLS